MKWYRDLCLLATLLAAGLLGTGCGGFTASPSVSPASFFLPGLVHAAPVNGTTDLTAETAEPRELASVR